MDLKKGMRVSTSETVTEIRKPSTRQRAYPVVLQGEIVEILSADEVYVDPPEYQRGEKKDRKDTKFPPGSLLCRVLIDGEKKPRMFHESQLNGE